MEDQRILITGGAGFIGSHVVEHMVKSYPNYKIVNLDALTYAGNLENLKSVEGAENYHFVKGDICDAEILKELFEKEKFTGVIHLAAESHVDRSITNPLEFIQTNVLGTVNLMQAAMNAWKDDFEGKRFYHISTDEVYGSLGKEGLFKESTPYDPKSPYSASKAGSDHFVRAYANTYGFPVVISNCSNNYGPRQFPEKLIPLFINNIRHMQPLPVYGDGQYIRDWLHVHDHAKAIDKVYHEGKLGETYNIGGWNEWANIDLIHVLIKEVDAQLGRDSGASESLITFVKDRPGHDKRYAIDAQKIKDDLGWTPDYTFEEGLKETVAWYLENTEWLDHVTSGAYQDYYSKQYASE